MNNIPNNNPEEWVKNVINKGYSAKDIKNILLKSKYKPNDVLKILSLHEKFKQESKKPVQQKVEEKKEVILKPMIKKLGDKIKEEAEALKGKVIEEYDLSLDGAKVKISIEKVEEGLTYNIYIPKIKIGTEALLDQIRKELISLTAMGIGEIVDEKSISRIKTRFIKDSSKLLQEKIPKIKKDTLEFLTGMLMQEMLGLGKIEFMINDPQLEEIVIVNSKEIRVYHKKRGWLQTNVTLKSEDEVTNYANIIARRVGRQISVLTPLLDAHVVTGDRANAVLYPIATKGNTITIRKFSRDPWTIIDLIENKTVGKDIAAILWLAIEYEMNVLFSGGTASGKTVFLNACMPFIPPNQRIISMEDTRELMLPTFLYWCPLVTRSPNAEGKGEVSMLDLLVNSLRMRPDRIVLGEIRRQREAEVLFEAMHTGHSVYSTVHADTANETIRRLTNPPINIPSSMLNNVNLNVVMFRDRRRAFRRVLQLAEYLPGKENFTANLLYRWMPEKDQFTAHNKSLSFFEQLSRNTGMDEKDIDKALQYKKGIFDWLIKNKIRDLESFGKVMNYYYTDPEELNSIIKSNQIKKVTEEKKEITL
ncbi:Flp pilus assembly complex ATPase component TadA [Candidatus Pacearchaeota archaeon]|nr:Flp pilus assembly complex ATPase component TadA [Candidatus Pacearchaeota archaeon]